MRTLSNMTDYCFSKKRNCVNLGIYRPVSCTMVRLYRVR